MRVAIAACRLAALCIALAAPAALAQSSSWEYRLAGGAASTHGRLEARPNASAVWGTVCGAGFDGTDAFVACSSVGYPTRHVLLRKVNASEYAADGTPFYLPGLECPGSMPARLDACTFAATAPTCTRAADVWLDCAPPTEPPPPSTAPVPFEYRLVGGSAAHGRLELRLNGTERWGLVCALNFTEADAAVACRALGLPTSPVAVRCPVDSEREERPSRSMPFLLHRPRCHGNESDFTQCVHPARNFGACTDSDYVLMLACGAEAVATPTPAPSSAACTRGALPAAVVAAVAAAVFAWVA